jgi:hypothetical protein
MTKIKKLVLNASLCLFPALGVGQTLDPSAILKPLSENWSTYSGDYSGMRDSRLTQIDQSNVKYLALAWTTRVTGGGGRDGHTLWQLLLEDQGRDAHRQSRNPETRGNPGTGAKNPTPSRPGARWKWSALHAIAELVEFPDHPSCARAFGLGTHRRTPFLVAHPLVQNQPK